MLGPHSFTDAGQLYPKIVGATSGPLFYARTDSLTEHKPALAVDKGTERPLDAVMRGRLSKRPAVERFYYRVKPIKKLKIWRSSVSLYLTGKAKSKASGAGPKAGTLTRTPKPGATR